MTLRVCVCVSVCVLVTRGPGGDMSAPLGTLLGSSAGFHTRLTSSYEDKAAILLDLLGARHHSGGNETHKQGRCTVKHTFLCLVQLIQTIREFGCTGFQSTF